MSRLTINSNIASLNAQRNFTSATKKLTESYTRLSSGLRINRAVDDAAGLSISESLKADTRLFNQGVRNLNDGASVLSIADGALNELSNITIRLRELATQSANGTLGNKQRLALDQEAQALSKEYNRIARTTEFNGRKLFDGDFGDLSLAAGGNASFLITDGLGGAIGDGSFSSAVSYITGSSPRAIVIGDLNGDGISDLVSADRNSFNITALLSNGDGSFRAGQSFSTGTDDPQSLEIADFNLDGIADLVTVGNTGIANIFIGNGNGSFKAIQSFVTVSSRSVAVSDFNNDGASDLVFSQFGGSAVSILFGNGNGTFQASRSFVAAPTLRSVTVGDFNGDGVSDLALAAAGVSLSILLGNGDGTFQTRQSFTTGTNPYSVTNGDFNGDGISDLVSADLSSNSLSVLVGNGNGSFKARQSFVTGTSPWVVKVGDFNGDGVIDVVSADQGSDSLSVFLGNSNQGVSALQSFSLKTKAESKEAMTYLESALIRLTKQRGHIGAFQSRVETATNNLQQASLAYSEANSRITDADIAEESSKLTANQIIQQAAASVLGQANLQPRLVLQLLEGI